MESIDLILMDYRLSSSLAASDVVHELKWEFPGTPIVVLSQEYGMPADMKARAVAFVRKGQPEELVNLLNAFRASGSAI
jgi:CheY-like chemotaxis protein